MRMIPVSIALLIPGLLAQDVKAPKPRTGQPAKRTIPRELAAKLRTVAKEYVKYRRVDETIRWAPTLCDRPPPGIGRFSASKDKKTHGAKLYYLFAKNRKAYWDMKKADAVGQVLVKEAWEPVAVVDEKKHRRMLEPKSRRPYAWKGRKRYHAGKKRGLFVMMRVDPKTRGTDDGWIYGTVDPDGKVSSAGRVASCMKCHVDAPFGRLFGLEHHERPKTEKRPRR